MFVVGKNVADGQSPEVAGGDFGGSLMKRKHGNDTKETKVREEAEWF